MIKRLLVSLVITSILLLLNIVFLMTSFEVVTQYKDIADYSSTVTGIVVSPVEGKKFTDRIEGDYLSIARYEVDGKAYKCEVSRETAWQEGDTVVIAYVPGSPDKAMSESAQSAAKTAKTLFSYVILVIVGLAALLGFVLSGVILKRMRKTVQSQEDK